MDKQLKKFCQRKCRLSVMQRVHLKVTHMIFPIFVQFLPKKNSNLVWFKLMLANKKKMALFPVPANQPHYKAETMTI